VYLSFGFVNSNIKNDKLRFQYAIADFIPVEIYTFKLFGITLSGAIRYHPGTVGISRLLSFESIKEITKK